MPVKPIPDGYHTVTPYLTVHDVSGLIAFAEKAFGAKLLSSHNGPDGKIGHAEFKIGDSVVMTGQAREQVPATSAMLYLYVPDTDAVYRAALAAGGKSLMEPSDQFYGDRNAGVSDPFGIQWWIATHVEDVSPEEMVRRSLARQTK